MVRELPYPQAASAPHDSTLTIRDANVALRAELRDSTRQGSDAFREPLSLSRQATVPAVDQDTDMHPASPPIVPQSSQRVVVPDLQIMRACIPATTTAQPMQSAATMTGQPPPPQSTPAPMIGQPPPTQSTAPMIGQPAPLQGTAPMAAPHSPTQGIAPMTALPPLTHAIAPMAAQPPPTQGSAPMIGQPPPTQPARFQRVDLSSSGTYKDPFCRRCGRYKKSDPVANGKHSSSVKRSDPRFCRVDPELYMPGYPRPGYEISEQ